MTFYDDPDRLSHPQAERLAEGYIDEMAAQKTRVTSRDVLRWSDYPDDSHNKKRIHAALSGLCRETDVDWAGRTVFEIPTE